MEGSVWPLFSYGCVNAWLQGHFPLISAPAQCLAPGRGLAQAHGVEVKRGG